MIFLARRFGESRVQERAQNRQCRDRGATLKLGGGGGGHNTLFLTNPL